MKPTQEELVGPLHPWREDVFPIKQDHAIEVVANGWHMQAIVTGRDPYRDKVLIKLLEKNLITCAFDMNGALAMKPTLLAHIQRWN